MSQGAGFSSKGDKNVMVAATINALLCQEEVVSIPCDPDKYVHFLTALENPENAFLN